MSTSLLYHEFGIVGYRYIRTEYKEGTYIKTDTPRLECKDCKMAFEKLD